MIENLDKIKAAIDIEKIIKNLKKILAGQL